MPRMTSKGQVTVPKPIRDYLGLRAGSAVEFEIGPGGVATVRAAKPTRQHMRRSKAARLRGRLRTGQGTDALMELLRDYAADPQDPGFADNRGQ